MYPQRNKFEMAAHQIQYDLVARELASLAANWRKMSEELEQAIKSL